MGSKTKVIECPVQKRQVEVTYKVLGSWLDRRYEVESCPAMYDWGGCDRQCKNLLAISPRSSEWSARR